MVVNGSWLWHGVPVDETRGRVRCLPNPYFIEGFES
jgi:hypothetical protein